MTISAVRNWSERGQRPPLRAGVTLLELVIAMSLLVLLLGIGAVSYAGGMDERALRQAAAQVEAMSSRGHAMSVLHQKPFWLEIREGKLILAGAETRRARPEAEEEFGSGAEEEGNANVVTYDEFSTPVEVAVRRWGTGEEDWIVPKEKEFVNWQFQATGLCEPLSIRLSYEGNWIILHMNPLTARAEDEESYIQ